MALVSGSLGTLLQGVSQQPARVRLDGQVSEQVNLISDVTLGLSTRPATNAGSYLVGADETYIFQDIFFGGVDYILGYKDSELLMWNLDGTAIPVTEGTSASKAYIGTSMQFHVVDKKIVALNREQVTAQDDTVPAAPVSTAIFHSLGGQFSKTYKVTLSFSNGVTVNASYTTPDGTGTGDANLASSEYIVGQLVSQLNAGALPAGTVGSSTSDVARYINPTFDITITTSDGEAGTVLRSMSSTVSDVVDLPRFAPNGTIVKVVSSEASEDDFWLKFVTNADFAEDGTAGFGEEGVWKEWYDPSEPRNFDLSTMPHVIEIEGNAATLRQGEWLGRSVGDSESAPFPSFIGNKIRDVDGFEGRLALLGVSSPVMSRTNEPFDFFRESATVVSASDPIDITSTKKDDLTLDWFVPFDRDLFVMSDPGDSQFVIRGGGIDANTASMVLTTEFEIASGGTPPVSTGRTILFPFSTGEYSGIKEFYTNSDNAANAANSLTETQDRYINGSISGMAVSQNFNLGLFRTTSNPKDVWVYKYLWDGTEVLQSAWGKWRFTEDVKHFFFRDSKVYFIGRDNSEVFIHFLDLNRPLGEYGYHEMVDRRSVNTVQFDTTPYVELPYPDARFIQSTGCTNEGLEAQPVISLPTSTGYKYIFDAATVPESSTLICGQSVDWTLVPSQVFAKDYQNNIDTSKFVTVQDYLIHVDKSGEFKGTGTSPYSPDWEYAVTIPPISSDLLQSGPIYIPWGERADWSELTLTGNDIRPVTIHEVEWIGQILKTKGRRS